MKTIIQIQTDPFALISQEFDQVMTPEKAVAEYRALQQAYRGGDGLNAKEIDAMLDSYFMGRGVDSNQYDQLNAEQNKWIQAVKRSIKRCRGEDAEEDIL